MISVNVNGRDYEASEDKTLLRFLRDDLHLTAAKDGCSAGVCGACTVLVGGVKKRACLVKLSQLAGQGVLTVEGIDPAEMAIYKHCFAAAGAVQCGFCIPGMIISAKGLLDANLNPTRDEVKKAIKGNLCRCTGYRKIEDAILMAAEYRREGCEIPRLDPQLQLESKAQRLDAPSKTEGKAVFGDDIYLPGMVYARMLFSRYPRARIARIDVSKAAAHPACLGVLTREDVPCNTIGHVSADQDVMVGVGEVTKYVGSVLAVVAAERYADLDEILSLIEVDYEELPVIDTPAKAAAPGAPQVIPGRDNLMNHSRLERGDVETALANSKYVVSERFTTPWQDHCFMETECCVAEPQGEDGLLLYTGCQSVYDAQRECAKMLQIPAEKLHCKSPYIGGGFGGKEDMSVQPYAALMAWKLKRPVKVRYTRQDSLNYHVKRHPMELELTVGCDEQGKLTAMKGTIVADTGAFASLGKPVLHRACVHAGGPYHYENIKVDGYAYYTNNVPSGAFRGFGVGQSCFAIEMCLDRLAEMAGVDPWEMRYRNVVRPGAVLPNGQIAGADTNMLACLEAVKDVYYANPKAGLACAFKNSGLGMGRPDTGRVLLSVQEGKIHVRTAAACMGQGLIQTLITILGEISGFTHETFVCEMPDTERTPDAGTTSASRQTLITGEAARQAMVALMDALQKSGSLAELEGREFLGEFTPETDPLDSTKEHPVSHVAYSYCAQVVILDAAGKVQKVVSALDVGTPINVISVEGQIEGGTVMALGWTLTEEYVSQAGYPQSKLATLGLMRADAVPEHEVILCPPSPENRSPYALGAKGCGELCAIPTAPACALAYYRRDGEFRTSLPLPHTSYRN